MRLINERTLQEGVDYLTGIEHSFARVISTYGIPPLWLRPPGFATLILIILEQQVSLQSARKAYERLQEKLGQITIDGFLGLTDKELKVIGFSRQKTGYCRELAMFIRDKTLDLDKLEHFDTGEVIRALTAIRGIGQWTSRIYLIMALRRADIWPSGDLALRKSFADLNQLPELLDDSSMETAAEKWKPWRAVAARILWHYYLSQNNDPGITNKQLQNTPQEVNLQKFT
jgi:DNA-3-methyladenine glycosylase II